MKKYKLLKDLPTFKAGDEFFIDKGGNLVADTPEKPKKVIAGTGDSIVPTEVDLMAYAKETLEQFPNILTEWFEEIKDFEVPDEFEMGFWTVMYGEDGFYTWYLPSDKFEEDYEKMLKHHMEVSWAFPTEKEAEKHLEWLKARAVLLEDAKGFKPDWEDSRQLKYYVFYDYSLKLLNWGSFYDVADKQLYFKAKEDVKISIKNHEKEWKIYLGIE